MMRLKKLNVGRWTVVAPINDRGRCEVFDALVALKKDPKAKSAAYGFVAQWEQIPSEGPRKLGTDFYHQVDSENEIYEFIKGAYRLLCFQANGRLVICCTVFRKKGSKTPSNEKKKAALLRRQYLAAVASSDLTIED